MSKTIQHHQLENGLVVVIETVAGVRSAAFSILVPAGAAFDADQREGTASVLCDMVLRGAGPRDSRKIVEDLDNLGVERGQGVGSSHTSISGATLASNLPEALEITADVLRRPHLPENQLDAARSLCLQELEALEDEPQQKVMVELRRRYYPHPWGRPAEGSKEGLHAVTADDLRRHLERGYRPNGTILGIAGNLDLNATRDLVEKLFCDWESAEEPQVEDKPSGPQWDHLQQETAQTQIGISYESVPYNDPEYYRAAAAIGVLSGGMSARLFTEVREKRGLCYAVHAGYHTLRDRASIVCYAGTTPERAQETLEVTLGELERLAEGIDVTELDRVKARVKSSLIMQQESTSARAATLARDWYHLGRTRPMEEIRRHVDALTCDDLIEHLKDHPPGNYTVVTLGPKPLEMPVGIS